MSELFVKKKKKKSFLQKAKRFGKQGCYGKGRELSEEEYHYYIRVLEQLKHVEKEEKDILINNFFREMEKEDKIKSLATNQIVSRILDDALPLAPISRVISIVKVFSADLRAFCTDPFASHVLQTLLTLSLKYTQECASHKQFDDDDTEKIVPLSAEQKSEFTIFILKASKFVYNNLHEFVCETYASHIVRTVLEVCSGTEVSKSVKCSQKAQTFHSLRDDPNQMISVPPEFLTAVHDFGVRLTQLPNFTDVISSECGSAVLQTALLVLSALGESERASALVAHITEHGFDALDSHHADPSRPLHPLFEYNATSRLMEVMVSSATDAQQDQIFNTYFSNQLPEIVKHKIGNFSVQRLLTAWKMKSSFVVPFDAVSECLQEARSAGSTGVIFALVQACKTLGSHQSRCLKRLMVLLECSEDETSQSKVALLLLYLLPLKELQAQREGPKPPPVSLHGALILQQLLNFNKPIKVVSSLLSLSGSELTKMACDPRGSHVTDAFATSPFVGDASRTKLVAKLEGHLMSLACSKHGSRSLEALWKVVGVKIRTKICQELFEGSSKLRESQFGTIIYNNFQIRHFGKGGQRKEWEDIQEKQCKKKQVLNQLLEEADDLAGSPKKKKRKEND